MKFKYSILLLLTILMVNYNAFSQSESPYETKFKTDGPAVVAGLGLSYLGLTLIKNKSELTPTEVAAKNKDDVFFLDRFSAGNFRDKADKDSYIPFYGSFAVAPIVALIDGKQRSHYGQVSVMFIETMSAAAASFTISAGLVKRSRPLVYNTSLPLSDRQDKDAQRSFFAGHTTATAAATFFAAKVFNDFNPDSELKPYVWTAAALVPAVVGYQRLRAGKHFLTDNILGYAVGAGLGILIPELHKKTNNSGISVAPVMGLNYQGLGMTYHITK
ncbi:PA-phosphatase [Pedobacter psychrophilus]|uniref:PA-phosphatase n=1 Tax=Pedobacter psychrophilus TaxID=1826909 RepID=A0A179DG98_9SPHI|nr:phosphatase PAP2 family protein [Pedobacter psychrophilus]OAQ39539.1 PA-phosphatase [Pedobacter psychrophilus]